MIVRHNIGPVKIGGTISRLSVGRPVPEEVLKHWRESGQLDALVKAGAIEDEQRPAVKAEPKKQQAKKEAKEEAASDGLVRENEIG